MVQLYDRATAKIICSLKTHTKKVTAVLATASLNGDGLPSFLVSSSLDKSVRVWAPNGTKSGYSAAANLAHGGEVNALALHPTDTLVASAAADGTWSIIDLASAKPSILLTVSLPADAPDGTANTAIAFHPDGKLLGVGSSDSVIRFFDIVTGSCLKTFDGHAAGAISSLSFSENGYSLASSALGSSEVKLWDLREGKPACSHTLQANSVVHAVAFDTSAQFLAAAGTDLRVFGYKKANKVVSWDQLVVAEDNQAELTAAAWGPDGNELAVAGMDRTVRFLSKPAATA